jgi:serine/threonine protein kinase
LNPERWRQIRDLFDAALALPAEKRQRFLDSACRSDTELRREVQSLLDSHAEAGDFLETQAGDQASSNTTMVDVDPWIGKTVGPYRVLERIGFGGMGVVYRAVDTRLGRVMAAPAIDSNGRRARHRL